MVRAVIIALVIFAFTMLIANLQIPADTETQHAADVGIFFVGLLVGIEATIAMYLDETKEV